MCFHAVAKILQRKKYILKKWLVISIYRLPSNSLSWFLESLTGIIDFFSSRYDNFIILGDLNPLDSVMKDFIKVNGVIDLIKRILALEDRALSFN